MRDAAARKRKAYAAAGISKTNMSPALAAQSAMLAAHDGAQSSMLAQQQQAAPPQQQQVEILNRQRLSKTAMKKDYLTDF
jgi:hypothetical protein